MIKEILLALLLVTSTATATAEVNIIVHPDNPIETLSVNQIYMIITGRQLHFDSGNSILVILLPRNNRATEALASEILDIPTVKLFKIIDRLATRYKAKIRYVDSEEVSAELVSKNINSISYVIDYDSDLVKKVEIDEDF